MLNFSNNLHKTRCMGVFGIEDCRFDVRIANFQIADSDGDYFTLILKFSNNWHKTCCMGIFWVADYDSEVRIGKFKIWCQNCKIRNGRLKMAVMLVSIESVLAIATKLGILGLSGSLIAILTSDL